MTKIVKINKEYIVFEVESSRGGTHDVIFNRKTHEWSCTCEDYWYRKRVCKHCYKAKSYFINLLNSFSKLNIEINDNRFDKVYEGQTINISEIMEE